jgi:hypothetical protein
MSAKQRLLELEYKGKDKGKNKDTPRSQQLQKIPRSLLLPQKLQPLLRKFITTFSVGNILDVNTSPITLAIQHVDKKSGGEFTANACKAIIEAKDVLIQHSCGAITTIEANKKIASLAEEIQSNRGPLRAIIDDTIGTLTTMKSGVAGAASAGGLYWCWINLVSSLANIQSLLNTPGGVLAGYSAIVSFKEILLPEGGLTWYDYLKLSLNPSTIAKLIPDIDNFKASLSGTTEEAGSLISKAVESLKGYALSLSDTILGGTVAGAADLATQEYTLVKTHLKQVSNSMRVTQTILYGWIGVFVVILIIFTIIHVRDYFNKSFLTVEAMSSDSDEKDEKEFRSKFNSTKSSKRSSKKSSKRSSKRSSKKSSKRSSKKSSKRSSKKSSKRSSKKSSKRSSKKSIR